MKHAWTRSRLIRLTAGFVLPPVLIALGYAGVNTWRGGISAGLAIGGLTLYYGLRYVGLQLIVYSLSMEFWVVPRLKNVYLIMAISSSLMLLMIATAFLSFFGLTLEPFLRDRLTPGLGIIIGSLLGYGLKRHQQKGARRG